MTDRDVSIPEKLIEPTTAEETKMKEIEIEIKNPELLAVLCFLSLVFLLELYVNDERMRNGEKLDLTPYCGEHATYHELKQGHERL